MDEKRQYNRLRVHWRVAMRRVGHPHIYGETLDLALAGASILSENNLANGTEVDLFIQVPPSQAGKPGQIIEIRASVQYAAFSTEYDLWRMGFRFLKIGGGKEALERVMRRSGN